MNDFNECLAELEKKLPKDQANFTAMYILMYCSPGNKEEFLHAAEVLLNFQQNFPLTEKQNQA